MSPADAELAKALILAGVEIGKIVVDLVGGKKVEPRRVRAVWADIEQALAKHETDEAERERWPEAERATVPANPYPADGGPEFEEP